jgi:hypothetical protein
MAPGPYTISIGSLWAALSASPRAQCTYLCEVVIWAGARGLLNKGVSRRTLQHRRDPHRARRERPPTVY